MKLRLDLIMKLLAPIEGIISQCPFALDYHGLYVGRVEYNDGREVELCVYYPVRIHALFYEDSISYEDEDINIFIKLKRDVSYVHRILSEIFTRLLDRLACEALIDALIHAQEVLGVYMLKPARKGRHVMYRIYIRSPVEGIDTYIATNVYVYVNKNQVLEMRALP